MARRKEPVISDSILDQLLAGSDAKTAFESNGLLDQLKKALAERALNAEMDHHLSGEATAGNSRNGYGRKTVLTDSGSLELSIPRDRQSSFDPQLLAKYQRRFPGFDEKIVSMYARGMSTREIVGHIQELYGIDVSPDLISAVTDAVLDEVATWQARPLEPVYPLVFFDALRVKIRDEGHVRNKAVHIALGVRGDGTKEILGLWIETNEGAKFWLRVMNELKNRGVDDILIAVVDGLQGFPEVINAVFAETTVQTCIVHLLRNSLDFASWKDRKDLARELKSIYGAIDDKAAETALTTFEGGFWGRKFPAVAQVWRRACQEVIPFLASPKGRAPDHLHHERHRSLEFQAASRCAGKRSFPERRRGDQTALPRLEQIRERVEDAAERMGDGKIAILNSVCGPLSGRKGVDANVQPHARTRNS